MILFCDWFANEIENGRTAGQVAGQIVSSINRRMGWNITYHVFYSKYILISRFTQLFPQRCRSLHLSPFLSLLTALSCYTTGPRQMEQKRTQAPTSTGLASWQGRSELQRMSECDVLDRSISVKSTRRKEIHPILLLPLSPQLTPIWAYTHHQQP